MTVCRDKTVTTGVCGAFPLPGWDGGAAADRSSGEEVEGV